jgi:hypothetical protein
MLQDNGATIMSTAFGVQAAGVEGWIAFCNKEAWRRPKFRVLSKFLYLFKLNFTSSKDIDLPFAIRLERWFISEMRLTADLINSSLSYLNPNKERELDLRGAFLKRADTTL